MTTISEVQGLLRELAQPAIPGERVKAAISRAARRSDLAYGRARSLWYGLAVVRAEEIDRFRERAKRRNDASEGELLELVRRLERIEASLGLALEGGVGEGDSQGCSALGPHTGAVA